MDFTTPQLVTWLITGAIAGYLVGSLLRWNRRGFGFILNIVIGLVGAFIGGLLFSLLNWGSELSAYQINLRDLISAFIGSLAFVGIWSLFRR